MKLVQLTRGKFAEVDDWNFDEFSQFNWAANKAKSGRFYARRRLLRSEFDGPYRNVYVEMQKCVLSVPIGMQVDHIDGNGLNNQLHNLRPATIAQNAFNRPTPSNSSTGYKGVYHRKTGNRKRPFQAGIKFNGKQNFIGSFVTKEEAAHAYNVEAVKLFGKFAKLNIIEGYDMSQYIMEVIVDTEAAEIEGSRDAAEEFIKSAIHESACIDKDQAWVYEAREVE